MRKLSGTAKKLPDVLPVFPLPGVVLLPGEVLPLHIFEPRYRAMVRDALEGQTVIGMIQPRPGTEDQLPGAPPIREIGGAGRISRHFEVEDGRFLIWLVGVTAFRVVEELDVVTPYRQVRAEAIEAAVDESERESVVRARFDLLASLPLLAPDRQEHFQRLMGDLSSVDDDRLLASAAQALAFTPEEKQELLEARRLLERYALAEAALRRRMASHPALHPANARIFH
ncbi:MAG: LON peptidase substrate-binding domain-containing protein [Acidobacteriota bacterium]